MSRIGLRGCLLALPRRLIVRTIPQHAETTIRFEKGASHLMHMPNSLLSQLPHEIIERQHFGAHVSPVKMTILD